MKKTDKLYIELYLCKIVSLCAEINYKVDRLGNITFKNKEEVIEKIKKEITKASEKMQVSEKEIRDYLVGIYSEKMIDPNFKNEGEQLISLLKGMNEPKINKKEEKESDLTR